MFRSGGLGRSQMEFAKLVLLNALDVALGDSLIQLKQKAGAIQKDYETNGYQGLQYAVVEKYNDESSRFETIVDEAQDLVEMIELVVSSIKESKSEKGSQSEHTNGSHGKSLEAWKMLESTLERIQLDCRQLKRQAGRIQANNERRYKIYMDTLNIYESYSVKRLTGLATVFLPLSLAASMLGMQTRFVKLKLLLYDFVGVGVLLALLMYTIYLIIKLASRKRSWRPFEQSLGNSSLFSLVGYKILILLVGYIIGGSFLAGMLRSVSYQKDVLGISFAISLAAGVLAPMISLLSGRRRGRNEWRPDPRLGTW